jgi:hypothetical protein
MRATRSVPAIICSAVIAFIVPLMYRRKLRHVIDPDLGSDRCGHPYVRRVAGLALIRVSLSDEPVKVVAACRYVLGRDRHVPCGASR